MRIGSEGECAPEFLQGDGDLDAVGRLGGVERNVGLWSCHCGFGKVTDCRCEAVEHIAAINTMNRQAREAWNQADK